MKIFWSQINCVQQFASSYLKLVSYLFVDFFTLKCFGVYHLTIKQSLFSLAKLKVDFFCKLLFTFLLTKITKLWSPHSISLLTQVSTADCSTVNSQDSSKSRKSKQYKRNNFSLILATFQSSFKKFPKNSYLKCCKKYLNINHTNNTCWKADLVLKNSFWHPWEVLSVVNKSINQKYDMYSHDIVSFQRSIL